MNPPRRIFTFWTERVPLTQNRQKSLELMNQISCVDVILVTPDNLDQWILPDHPLHPAFKHLSAVHKSDYLRCYFMHHHGGGYCDLKPITQSWVPFFECLEAADESIWMVGYAEIGTHGVAVPHEIEGTQAAEDLRQSYGRLIGNGAYLSRRRNPLTTEWYNQLLAKMDRYADELEKHPANPSYPRTHKEGPWGYPIRWSEILGQIFHPLCLKYSVHITPGMGGIGNAIRCENYE